MSPSRRPRKLVLALAATALVAAPAPALAMPAGPDAPASDAPSLAGLPALDAARSVTTDARRGAEGGLPEILAVWAGLAAVAAGGAVVGRRRSHTPAGG